MVGIAKATARFLVSAIVLAALLVGVPLVLAAVGWPLPRAVSWDDVRESLSGSTIADDTVLKALAIVGWLAWAQVVAAAAVEVHAWLRGRAAPVVRLAGPIQPFVRYLVVAMLVSVGSGRSTGAAADARPLVATLTLERAAAEECPPGTAGAAVVEQAAPAPLYVSYTVRPRDSLWNIAEEQLGDGFRWREVWELNRGVNQSDGRSLQDPDLLRPGWVLRMPDGAAAPGAGVEPARSALVPTEELAAPDHLDDTSDRGQQSVTLDPVSPTTTTTTTPTTTAEVTSPSPPAATDRGGSDRSGEQPEEPDPAVPAPVGVAAAGVLAAGLVATLNKLRRAQIRRRQPGVGIPTPQPEAAAAENTLRCIATLDRAERVDLALRAVAGCLAGRGDGVMPVIQAVLAGDDIEVLFEQAVHAAPGPFRVEASGRAWTLPANADAARVHALAAEARPPAPALVPAGRVDDRDLLIDLEAAAVTTVAGSEQDVEAVLWHLAAGLATSQWADDLRIILAGSALPGFESLERVEVVEPSGVLDCIRDEVIATRAELAAHGAGSTLEARARGGSWTPTVLVLGRDGAEHVPALLALAGRGTGLAVLSLLEHEGADRRLEVSSGVVRITPPGVAASLPDIPADVRHAIGELFEATAPTHDGEGEPILDLTGGDETHDVPSLAVVESPTALAEGALLVRALGSVEVEGGPAIDRRKSEELVVYLAMHPDGADEQALKTALWPDTAPTSHTFNQVVSRARICLGTGPDGSHYLPRLDGGRYRLSEWVTTDVERLTVALRNARAHPNTETMEHLAAALRLVRGQPFQGVKAGYEWAHGEGHATRSEIVAAEAAHLVAAWHLEHGDAMGALWAAGQGLLASPFDEALFRDRMRAHAAAGNLSAVESVMRELCKAVDALEPYDSLHPETVELYEELTSRRVG